MIDILDLWIWYQFKSTSVNEGLWRHMVLPAVNELNITRSYFIYIYRARWLDRMYDDVNFYHLLQSPSTWPGTAWC